MKKRSAYRPKPIKTDPMRAALARQCVLTDDERLIVMREARPALERIRLGTFDRQDWAYLADAANVGEALANIGICSDAPSVALLQDMQQALKAIAERANGGKWVARGPELVALKDGLDRHEIQLEFCSLHELRRAVAMVEANVRAARAGRMSAVSIIDRPSRAEAVAA